MFKQILSGGLAVAMACSLAACSTPASSTTTSSTSPDASSTADATAQGNLQADIVIIGAGGAGMTAAVEAVNLGMQNIVIVEKTGLTGGNTTRATGGINASETTFQAELGIEDSNALYYADTMAGGYDVNDPSLVEILVENSAEAIYFLNDLGAQISAVGLAGGASEKRTHSPADKSSIGPVVVNVLTENLNNMGVPVLFNTEATELVLDETGAVAGVVVVDAEGSYTIEATAVVVATGGFGANNEMVAYYDPALEGFGTTNVPGATGDGITMVTAIGGGLTDIEQIQIHPTVHPETQTLITEGTRGAGAVLVNVEGERFTNELLTRDVVSANVLAQTDGYAWIVFDDAVRGDLAALEKYFAQGIVFVGESYEALAAEINLDPATFANTMAQYADAYAAGTDEAFGREMMEYPLTEGNVYAIQISPAIHHTMGGVSISTAAEVLTEDGTAIPGLFAAGEVTGGVHGANRLGGNAVTDVVVFGRVAGESASAYVNANGGVTEATIVVEAKEEVTPEVQGTYTDGVYTGIGQGIGGDMEIQITVANSNIIEVEIVSHNETTGIYEAGLAGVREQMIRTQQLEVDAVAGATITSDGVMQGAADALGLAG